MNQINPYPTESISYRIYENNRNHFSSIFYATEIDKMIICLYVMGNTMKKIAKIANLNVSTISNKLNKYEVKIQ